MTGRVVDEPFSDQSFQVGIAVPGRLRHPLSPPGAEHLADDEFGVQWAAQGEQFTCRTQHFREQGVGRRRWRKRRPGDSMMTRTARASWGIPAAALRTHKAQFPRSVRQRVRSE